MRQFIYEHALTPGGLVDDPVWIMTVFHEGRLLGRYGYWELTDVEIEDAATFRASTLLGVSFLDQSLNNCVIALTRGSEMIAMRYSEEKMSFYKI